MLRKLALAGALAGTAAVVSCARSGQETPFAAALHPGFGLFYLDEGASAKLAYGQANSDNVGLMLQCAKGSELIEVSDMARSSPDTALTLIAAGRTSALKAVVQPGPGAPVVTARAPSSSPALAGFRQSGRIEVSYAGLRYGVAARPQERAGIERFFAACERRA